MKNTYVAAGLGGLSIAGLAWIEARTFPWQGLQEGLGAAFFPWLVLGLLISLSLVSIVYGLAGHITSQQTRATKRDLMTVMGLFGILAAYGLLFRRLGFPLSTFFFLCFGMIVLGAKWYLSALAASLTTATLYVLFVVFFHVPLP